MDEWTDGRTNGHTDAKSSASDETETETETETEPSGDARARGAASSDSFVAVSRPPGHRFVRLYRTIDKNTFVDRLKKVNI